MLSHRRLLIGDPKQLPPFGEEKVKAVLRDPERLKRAFECGRSLLQRSYYGLDIDEVIERYASVENIKRVAGEVERTLLLFAHLHSDTFRGGSARPMAGRLDEQYRMHPIIADLVSRTFYEGELRTADKTRGERSAADCPYEVVASMPVLKAPIVVVDVPWIHKSGGRRFRERTPAYHNPTEVQAVLEVLAALRPSPGAKQKPSLAVLTPYNEQVKQISQRVAMEKSGRLAHLAGFDVENELVHTIDSFQGDEADIVVVSLVRNNARPWRKGLGILADARRMNVLLSRARWKLVIVGSLEFLRHRFPPLLPVVEGDPLYFLRKLNRAFSTSRYGVRRRAESGFGIVPYQKLVGPEQR
jgi:superfamily I DNA and/or RNA helicase